VIPAFRETFEGIVTGKIATPFGPIDHAEYRKQIADVKHIFIQ
jgi:hypothetical protein